VYFFFGEGGRGNSGGTEVFHLWGGVGNEQSMLLSFFFNSEKLFN